MDLRRILKIRNRAPVVNDFEHQSFPAMTQAKVTMKNPGLSDLQDACEELLRQGVPTDATIGFQQWNSPPDNYYLIATWPVHGDRQP